MKAIYLKCWDILVGQGWGGLWRGEPPTDIVSGGQPSVIQCPHLAGKLPSPYRGAPGIKSIAQAEIQRLCNILSMGCQRVWHSTHNKIPSWNASLKCQCACSLGSALVVPRQWTQSWDSVGPSNSIATVKTCNVSLEIDQCALKTVLPGTANF